MTDEPQVINSATEEPKGPTPEDQEKLDGSPSRVKDEAGFIRIQFQLGPVKEKGVNGAQIEDVLYLLKFRLEGFQKGDFRCRENALAITKIEEAIQWLQWRTARRQRQGTEGTNKEVAEGDIVSGDQNQPKE